MEHNIRKIGIIGAGTMGSQLAALTAGAGVRVELMDVDGRAAQALGRLSSMRPIPFFERRDLARIRPGDFNDDIERLRGCDWIIETVIENLSAKREIFSRLENVVRPDAIVTSNTSGILRKNLSDKMGPSMKRRFFIAHFFNPPRYMKLVEIICGEGTDLGAVQAIENFLKDRLGKGVIHARDTPAFIANRIGIFHTLDVMNRAAEEMWPIEAVDAVLGRATARPATAIYKTVDIVGIDTLAFSAETLLKGCADESISRVRIPQYVQKMLACGWTGVKAGRGFYYRDRKTGKRYTFDHMTYDYRASVNFSTPSLTAARDEDDPAVRLQGVVFSIDQAGEIAWPAVSNMLAYAAARAPEISDDIISIDRAMRWGYNWEMGPFEMWDALGVDRVARRLSDEGRDVPKIVREMLDSGNGFFYSKTPSPPVGEGRGEGKKNHNFHPPLNPLPSREGIVGGIVEKNSSVRILDLGDGVLACEFRTKMNSIDGDVIEMLSRAIDRAESDGQGLMIANEGENFSAGANLKMILGGILEKKWNLIDEAVRSFQAINQRIRYARVPVLAVPFGMTLGGGCEICLACAGRTAAIETYMGLVEMLVGLVPAGGGCKNLLVKLSREMKGGPQPFVSTAFSLIAKGGVSISARDAVALGIMSTSDEIVFDRDELIRRAKEHLLSMARGYVPPRPAELLLPGRGGEMALIQAAEGMRVKGIATMYDVYVARKLARILAGGDVSTVHSSSEEHILDLEREAFMSLVGEPKTAERIEHMLKTGKPLRN